MVRHSPYHKVVQTDHFPEASTAKYVNMMPNPDRILADGEPLYTSFIDYFGDDVSGNKSKSWNKHWNLYFSHRNLPRQMLQQEFHVHFLSTSPFASVSEQYSALKEQMEYVYLLHSDNLLTIEPRSTHTKPIQVYDIAAGQGAKVRILLDADRSDNPMQSESTCHVGPCGNLNCRKCKNGGTMTEKESDTGYHKLFSVRSHWCRNVTSADCHRRLGSHDHRPKLLTFYKLKHSWPVVVCEHQLMHCRRQLGSKTLLPNIGSKISSPGIEKGRKKVFLHWQ
jgi:hypothetical protein